MQNRLGGWDFCQAVESFPFTGTFLQSAQLCADLLNSYKNLTIHPVACLHLAERNTNHAFRCRIGNTGDKNEIKGTGEN
ncbi:hypothetical protein ADH70_015680 [Blautia pseudococcoides]|uniref:Uncharacterized protein n=1 Tax=Blautia pseudococcoides TaxID=1796616 RepID=A0A1C7IE62_9FIRM|nr:hypothetical protein A4V09_17140 [Blautia pseudococcoides]ASU30115.1 hypothetical protein ADH70_015680 [Blautia pseudococcoides]